MSYTFLYLTYFHHHTSKKMRRVCWNETRRCFAINGGRKESAGYGVDAFIVNNILAVIVVVFLK